MSARSTEITSAFPDDSYKSGRTQRFSILCISIAYGYVMSQLPDIEFHDFYNYLGYADNSLIILLRNFQNGIAAFLSNEPVWLIINAGLRMQLGTEAVVRTIIFFSAFSFAWLVLRHHPKQFIWLILFLFLPQVIKNYLIHLRQGVAIAIFLWGWFSVKGYLRWLLIGLAPFIHASFFFILFLLALTQILRILRFASGLKAITYGSAGLVVALSMGALAELVAARQGEFYTFAQSGGSGLGFLLWVLILILMISTGKTWLRKHAFECGLVIFYIVNYWLNEVSGRIFESGLIVVLIACLSLPGWKKYTFLVLVISTGALTWFLRTWQPAFGFASA